MKHRLAALLLLCLAPAIAFRLGGSAFWITMILMYVGATSLAVYALYDDGILRDVAKRGSFDIPLGFAGAALLFVSVHLAFAYVIAPTSELHGALARCTLRGPMIPRLAEPSALLKATEWLRAQLCLGYAATLTLPLAVRPYVVVLVASLEEIAWRGGAQQAFSERYGSTRGWIITSVLFSLAHLLTPVPALALLALPAGLVWGAMYRYRGRLLPGVFSHATFSLFLFYVRPLVGF
jgi:membrane protease YdiL (CAAX protease family)